jgi:Smr domain
MTYRRRSQRVACARSDPTPQAGKMRLRLATLSPRGGQGTAEASGKRRGAVGAIPASSCRVPTAAEASLRRIFRVPSVGLLRRVAARTGDTLRPTRVTCATCGTRVTRRTRGTCATRVTRVTCATRVTRATLRNINVHRVPIEQSIDLHTFSPRDVPSVVDEYIRAAHEAGLREVRLIHGRGIGVQRARVHQVLRDHPLVESFADAAETHLGATVAVLKRPSDVEAGL